MTVHTTINDVRHSFTDRLHKLSVYRQFAPLCLLAALCLPVWSYAQSAQRVQKPEVAPQPEEQPTAPAPPPTLEHMPSRLPTVTFHNGELSIIAYNSTLSDILEAVSSQTGATIDIPPDATERVIVRLGPGPARGVLDSLLAGSHFNFILLGSAADPEALTKVVLTPKSGTAAEKGSVPQAAQVLPNRIEARIARQQESSQEQALPIRQAEDSAPVKNAAAATAAEQENAAKQDSAPAQKTQDKTESAMEGGNQSGEDHPRTPNIKTAQEVLQDLYARRRQSMEQQQQQQPPQ